MASLKLSHPKHILIAALIAVGLVSGVCLYAQTRSVPETVMMTADSTGINGPLFDATKWFSNGMYVTEDLDGKANPYIMTRAKPFVFKAKDNDFLVQVAIEALEDVQPEVNARAVWNAWPVLTRRVRYSHSFFLAPNKPSDVYNLFLQVSYRRFVIQFRLDGDDGNLTYNGEVQEVKSMDPLEEEHTRIFEEMDDAGTR